MLKTNSIKIFTRNSAGRHILKTLSQHFLSYVPNFYGNTSLQLVMVAGGVTKILFFKCPTGKNPMRLGLGFVGGHSPMETSLSLKNLCKNSMVCSDVWA